MFVAFMEWATGDIPRPPEGWKLERSRAALAAWYVIEVAVGLVIVVALALLWYLSAVGS